LSFLDIRKIEHIFPSSYENLDLAFFYHEMHDNFSEVDIVIDEAYTVLSEQAWDDGPEYYEEDEEDY
jgi:SNF2 family DNA or RNA helicase